MPLRTKVDFWGGGGGGGGGDSYAHGVEVICVHFIKVVGIFIN
jgi:hypothetical protein